LRNGASCCKGARRGERLFMDSALGTSAATTLAAKGVYLTYRRFVGQYRRSRPAMANPQVVPPIRHERDCGERIPISLRSFRHYGVSDRKILSAPVVPKLKSLSTTGV